MNRGYYLDTTVVAFCLFFYFFLASSHSAVILFYGHGDAGIHAECGTGGKATFRSDWLQDLLRFSLAPAEPDYDPRAQGGLFGFQTPLTKLGMMTNIKSENNCILKSHSNVVSLKDTP